RGTAAPAAVACRRGPAHGPATGSRRRCRVRLEPPGKAAGCPAPRSGSEAGRLGAARALDPGDRFDPGKQPGQLAEVGHAHAYPQAHASAAGIAAADAVAAEA